MDGMDGMDVGACLLAWDLPVHVASRSLQRNRASLASFSSHIYIDLSLSLSLPLSLPLSHTHAQCGRRLLPRQAGEGAS